MVTIKLDEYIKLKEDSLRLRIIKNILTKDKYITSSLLDELGMEDDDDSED